MIGERIFGKKRRCFRTQAKSTVWVRSAVSNARGVAAVGCGMTTAASADGKWQEKEDDKKSSSDGQANGSFGRFIRGGEGYIYFYRGR